MSSKNTFFSENDLDKLLGQAFLNLDFNQPKNLELMNAIATHHLINTPASAAGKWKTLLSSKFLLGTLLLLLALSAVWIFIPTQSDKTTENTPTVSLNPNSPTTDNSNQAMAQNQSDDQKTALSDESLPVSQNDNTPPENSFIASGVLPPANENDSPVQHTERVFIPADSTYIFPVLTEDEKKAHYKQKNKMVNSLVKLNKEKFAYIPSGTFDYKKQTVSIQSFYAQTTEVSNLEYRTFLSDLILQDRKQEFLSALPDESQWKSKLPFAYNEPMAAHYFTHAAYNNYPVVNIPRKGAELYCAWLTAEVNKVLQKNEKPLICPLRLPNEYEWSYAASAGKSRVKYANGNSHIRNSKGCYEMNYVCHSLAECQFDSTLNIYIPVTDIRGYFDDGAFHTASVTSYIPNEYGLYCMAGNVAEMVVMPDTKTPSTKGGSWFSCDYFLEIEAEDEFKGEINPSPFIGFRPVFSVIAN